MSDYLIGDALERPGVERVLRVVKVPNPALGAEVVKAVPGGELWQLLAFHAVFTAGATVATRTPGLRFDDGENTFGRYRQTAGATAGQVFPFSAAAGLGHNNSQGFMLTLPLPSPPLTLAPGWRISTDTQTIQADDQWSEVVLLVEAVTVRSLAAQEAYERRERRQAAADDA